MSYCRWSSDHFECDVYVYKNVSGYWTTHVAGRRRKNKLPDSIKAMYPAGNDPEWAKKYTDYKSAHNQFMRTLDHEIVIANGIKGNPVEVVFLNDSEFEKIDDEDAGKTFNDDSPGQCADTLQRLLAKGYAVPQRVINALRAEQAEMASGD